jgi:hypothetical protein
LSRRFVRGVIMDESTKKVIRRLAEDGEARVARSILRWKYKKEGIAPPGDEDLESQSRRIADTARGVISERGKNLWNEIKKVYAKSGDKGDPGR